MLQIVRPNGDVLFLDSTTKVTVDEGAAVALHPVEKGSPASDHVELTSTTLSLDCVITESPTVSQQQRSGTTNSAILQSLRDVLRNKTGPDRITAAQEFLRASVGEFLQVTSSRFAYKNCLLSGWPGNWTIVRSVPFTLTFTVVRRIEIQEVRVPPQASVPAVVTDETDEGAQGTGEPEVSKTLLKELSEVDLGEAASNLIDFLNPFAGAGS
jgi:hypothetical protein